MTIQILRKLLLRDLATLADQVHQYPDEADLWRTTDVVRNSGGNLTLHLCGNLQHFLGSVLAGSGYTRDRDGEFSRQDVPRAELLAEIDRTVTAVTSTLDQLDEGTLDAPYPLEIAGARLSTGTFLTHLCVHLGYHLGQLDYHRRFVTGGAASPGALSPRSLAD